MDCKKMEHGCRMIYAGTPTFLWFGAPGRSCSNVLASTVRLGAGALRVVLADKGWLKYRCQLGIN